MNTVLFTASTYSHIANFHRPYLQSFQKMGWNVHIACGGSPISIPEADFVIHLPFEKRMESPANFRAQHILRRAMEHHGYSLVCTHTSLAAFFTRMAAVGLKPAPPIVNVVHGYLFHERSSRLKRTVLLCAEKCTMSQTDLLLTMNQWDFNIAQRYRLGKRIEAIPGIGVDFSCFPAFHLDQRRNLRKSLGFSNDDFVLIYAAEYSARKNQTMLIRALPALPRCVKLFLPGQGALLEHCQALVQQLNVSDRVRFPGQLAEIPKWYSAADAAVSSSCSEGLPFNIMEAMYYGLPIVASAVKGHTDLIQHEVNGLLFPYNDVNAFVGQLSRLLESRSLRKAIGDTAKASIFPYRLEAVLPNVMQKYLSVVKVDAIPLYSR